MALLATLRWLVPAALPAALCVLLARRTAAREPSRFVALTFALGVVAGIGAEWIVDRASRLTGLDVRVASAGEAGALVFLFFVVAPVQEAAKVAGAWPVFVTRRVDESYDGVVYATASALGFAAVEDALVLHAHPAGAIWLARALLALPAHVFFACLWGYALARARHTGGRAPIFPVAFVAVIAMHGVYAHLVYGCGPGALLAVAPLLGAMGFVSLLLGRDLRERSAQRHAPGATRARVRRILPDAPGPSLSAVRAALRRADEPIHVRWVVGGALVSLGAMFAGVAVGTVAARWLGVDLSTVDDRDLRHAAPAILLGAAALASFPLSGWLVARASAVHTLLEPALATGLALAIALVGLGLAAPAAVVFGVAASPIAWLLSCAGAWAGRSTAW